MTIGPIEPDKTCTNCGRTGSQRFHKPSPRSTKWVCDNEAACAQRAVKDATTKTNGSRRNGTKKAAKNGTAKKGAKNVRVSATAEVVRRPRAKANA